MKRKCATVSVEVRKSQHKYVIGPKGSGIAEILQDSGVSVEMPPTDTDKETITLRVISFNLFSSESPRNFFFVFIIMHVWAFSMKHAVCKWISNF